MWPLGEKCGVRWNMGQMTTQCVVTAVFVLALLCVARAVSTNEDSATAFQDGGHVKTLRNNAVAAPSLGRSLHYRRRGHHRRRRPGRHSFHNKRKHSRRRRKDDNTKQDSGWREKLEAESCNATSLASLNRTYVESMAELDGLLCHNYHPWSQWRACNSRCLQTRVRRCRHPDQCWARKLRESKPCRRKRSRGRYRCPSRRNGESLRWWYRLVDRGFYDIMYSDWSSWGPCTRSCSQRRRKRCTLAEVCQNSFVQEARRCGSPGSRCHRRYMQKNKPSDAGDDVDEDMTSVVTEEHVPTRKDETDAGPEDGNEDEEEEEEEEEAPESEEETQVDTEKTDLILAGLHHGTCGVRPPAKRGSYRVVGGQMAQRLGWPWQMAILTRFEEQFCAGTLIAPHWVLTAAHCVRKKKRRRRFIVRAGEHDLAEYEGSEDSVKPEKEFPHPDFDYHTITNDIALVRLTRPLEPRSHPGYACLPEPGFTPDKNSLCYILGWGKRRNTHLFGADVLHEARVPLVTHKRCQKVFDYDINNVTQLCAGYKRGGSDACAGDSGGPLLCPKTEGGVTRWFLTGITSYGEGCGRRGKFGIYTNVVSYRDWIANVIQSY